MGRDRGAYGREIRGRTHEKGNLRALLTAVPGGLSGYGQAGAATFSSANTFFTHAT